MNLSSAAPTWYDFLQELVFLTKHASETDRRAVLERLLDLCSDPALAKKVVSVAQRQESHLLSVAPELYWAAQLTLAGSNTVH